MSNLYVVTPDSQCNLASTPATSSNFTQAEEQLGNSKMITWFRGKLTLVLLLFQVIFIVLFALFVEYDPLANAQNVRNSRTFKQGGHDPNANNIKDYYPSEFNS